ncbi:FxsC-like protein [Streptacidiphilus sp. MAP12-20]|uniref:TIR-like protein FxsC n=1 Tax=Streptacidiphilus sp. MAP12-20 TaxID=3156299 RepID=UPI0035178ECE
MIDKGSWPEDVPRPFFFLSYAHAPRVPRSAGGPGNAKTHWEEQLFRDLCGTVAELAGLDDDEPAGFMDTGMHLGEGWSERITEAIAHCRVFVPLYSPRYFRSQACGQEWNAFASRQVLINRPGMHASQISGVVPVQWVVVGQDDMPEVARPLQYAHRDFGADYVTEGLLTLSRLGYFRQQYEIAVLRLAQTIVRVAQQTTITVGRRRDFQDRPSAFQPPDQRRRLRIAVLAPDVRNLPVGRSADAYGISAVDWKPYNDGGDTLAKRAAFVARQSEFHPSIHEFEEEAQLLLRGEAPAAPGVLLLDRWSLLDKDRRELLKRFDAQNPTWVSVLEPWPADDPECERRNEQLTRLADETLTHMRVDRRKFREPNGGVLGTLDDFEDALPGAAMAAQHAFDQQREESRPRQGGSGKPNLRSGVDPPSYGTPQPEPPQQQPPQEPGPGEDSHE